MHLAEGILSVPVLAGSGALAVAGTWFGLQTLSDEDIPRAAMLTTVFFVASLVHLPLGVTSAHLVLNGLMGLLLGWAAVPAIVIGLTLQAILFRHGGLTVLGVNTLIMAVPAIGVYAVFRPLLRRVSHRSALYGVGFAAGFMAILGGALLAALALALTGRAFQGLAVLFLVTHLPLGLVEGLLTGSLLLLLQRGRPGLFPGMASCE